MSIRRVTSLLPALGLLFGLLFGLLPAHAGPSLFNLGFGETGSSVLHAGKWLVGSAERLIVHDLESGVTQNPDRRPKSLLALSGKWLVVKESEYQGGSGSLVAHDLESGETTDFGRATYHALSGKWLAKQSPGGALQVHDLESGETTDLGFTREFVSHSERLVVFGVREGAEDRVIHVYDLDSGETTNLGLVNLREFRLWAHWVSFIRREDVEGVDLNGDGDTDDSVVQLRDIESGETKNFNARFGWFLGESFNLWVTEEERGVDLNGDGDTDDCVVHVHDLESGLTTNTRQLGPRLTPGTQSDSWYIFFLREDGQGADLNGDGDTDDSVLHVHDSESGQTRNLGWEYATLSRPSPFWGGNFFAEPLAAGNLLAFTASEPTAGKDFNSDGDTEDCVVHVVDLASGDTLHVLDGFAGKVSYPLGITEQEGALSTNWLSFSVQEQSDDLNRDGDLEDWVAHVLDLESGETTNVGVAVPVLVSDGSDWFLHGDRLVLPVSESGQGSDLNGDGDTKDNVLHTVHLSTSCPTFRFLRGDCDGDGSACSGVNDALELLSWLFLGRTKPSCLAACDPDGNGELELADAVYGINFCFSGTDAPVAPFPACGSGTEADVALGCATSPVSCN